ncbi:abortive infection family protein [Psychroflexus montanilacus]|uniref:abortive infection family protein n=1 Tax=Psychroflexus montanilacus TaxID=2873598 RepID=UPI001CCC4787|nr:abortive infection family protein [Psychroflexus montanilacus]MBZ9650717.1 abortive infection family protein [Psychroflexus montanilacus]
MQEELEQIEKFNEYQLVEYFQDGVVARSTGDGFDDQLYKVVRTKLIRNKAIEKQLPEWVKNKRTIDQFWTFIKGRFSTYQERREFLWSEFSPILHYLEKKSTSPLDESIVFDEAHIHTQWQKALDRKQTEPEGAITSARTLIESILKHILDEQEIDYNDAAELPELYKEVAKSLNLAPENHQEQIFKQILGGASGIVSGLGALRNKLGDAHGKSKKSIKPSERHSELAVNLAGSMATFLFKTYQENKAN